MAWDESGTAKEVESLKKRYPKKGLDGTIPAGIRAVLREKEQDALTPPSKYAKGGSVRGSGCAQRGVRKCKVV